MSTKLRKFTSISCNSPEYTDSKLATYSSDKKMPFCYCLSIFETGFKANLRSTGLCNVFRFPRSESSCLVTLLSSFLVINEAILSLSKKTLADRFSFYLFNSHLNLVFSIVKIALLRSLSP